MFAVAVAVFIYFLQHMFLQKLPMSVLRNYLSILYHLQKRRILHCCTQKHWLLYRYSIYFFCNLRPMPGYRETYGTFAQALHKLETPKTTSLVLDCCDLASALLRFGLNASFRGLNFVRPHHHSKRVNLIYFFEFFLLLFFFRCVCFP